MRHANLQRRFVLINERDAGEAGAAPNRESELVAQARKADISEPANPLSAYYLSSPPKGYRHPLNSFEETIFPLEPNCPK